MSPQRFAVFVLCGTFVLNGWVAAELAGLGAPGIESGGAQITGDAPGEAAIARDSVDRVSVQRLIDTAFADLAQMLPLMRIASASAPDPAQNNVEASALPFEVPEIEPTLGRRARERWFGHRAHLRPGSTLTVTRTVARFTMTNERTL